MGRFLVLCMCGCRTADDGEPTTTREQGFCVGRIPGKPFKV